MRTWNFVKLDDISYQVTETGKPAQKRRSRASLPAVTSVAAIVLGVVLGAAQPASANELRMSVNATPSISTVIIEGVETSQIHPAPFADEFAMFGTDEFLDAHSDVLRSIAAVGSSLDDHRSSDGVMLALQIADDDSGDRLNADEIKVLMDRKRALV